MTGDRDRFRPHRIRRGLLPGDLGTIVQRHGTIYSAERGFDVTFEAYVAGPLAEFTLRRSEREAIWIAEQNTDGAFAGCVALVAASEHAAQLRWFLVVPEARRAGLGHRLLVQAIAFARAAAYAEIILWTEGGLVNAARLYQAAGFRRTEERPGRLWGVDVVEEKYLLRLS